MWERFSYYGMRALLILFMAKSIEEGGLGLTDKTAAAIYGLYTAAVYLAALPGGWIADRFLGAQRSVWYGGIVIAIGQFTLAFSQGNTFFLGLVTVVIGTGMLKPNVSAIVGELYPEGGARRDAGFTIFYMGINLGAAIGPLISGALGERINWHYGFGAAGVGMVLGLIQYRLTQPRLGQAGLLPGRKGPPTARDKQLLLSLVTGLALVVGLTYFGVIPINAIALAQNTTYLIVGVAAAYFVAAFLFFGLDATEKRRLAVIAVLFVSSAVFWSGFEQAGSSLNLFADRFTQRVYFGFEIPAGWFQSLGPICIITLAPVMAWVWVFLARRDREPSLPAKFGWGLLLLGSGFLVMAAASALVAKGAQGHALLAREHVPAALVRRTVPEPGGPKLGDEARPETPGGTNDGPLVPGHLPGQPDRRFGRGRAGRRVGRTHGPTLSANRPDDGRRRRHALGARQAGAQADGGRQVILDARPRGD